MSNVGKSHWSEQLATGGGFEHICCDDLIETKLSDVLSAQGFSGGIQDVAQWMGQPYDERFAANQQTYLDLETAATQGVIRRLKVGSIIRDTVIDTTGSVVHTSPEICRDLSDLTTVVHLEASPQMQQAMFELYIAEPKPVVWGDVFHQEEGEEPEAALERCYPDLLNRRHRLYTAMAHITIPREVALSLPDSESFLQYVRSHTEA
jgi:shikimate kinase